MYSAVFMNNCQCRLGISSSSSIYLYSTVYHSVHLYTQDNYSYGMRDFPLPKSVRPKQKNFNQNWSPLQIFGPLLKM